MTSENEKMVAVFNKGQRTYDTSAGKLHPKQSVEVPEAEAKALMDYFDIVDLAKVAPKATAQMKDLKAENERLKADLAKHQEKNPEPAPAPEEEPEEKETHHKGKDSGKGGHKGKK